MKIVQTVSDKTLTCSYSSARSCQSKPSLMMWMQSHLIPTLCHISWTSHITHIITTCANTQKPQTSVVSSVIRWPTKKGGRHVSGNWNVDSCRFCRTTFFVLANMPLGCVNGDLRKHAFIPTNLLARDVGPIYRPTNRCLNGPLAGWPLDS